MAYVKVDIEVYEFVDGCTKSEIKELIEQLSDRGHLKANDVVIVGGKEDNLLDDMWNQMMSKIVSNRLRMTKEEEELLEKIANRF